MSSRRLTSFILTALGMLASGGPGWMKVCAAPITSDAHTLVLDHFDGTSEGTTYGTAMYEPGMADMGQARRLSAGQYTRYGLPSWSGTQGTIEVWLKVETGGRLLNFNWNNTESEPSAGHVLHLHSLDAPGVHIGTWRDIGPTFHLDGPAIPHGVWTHLAFSWSDAGSKMYVDGEVVESSSENARPSWPSWGYLNYWGASGSIQFLGLVDELHISTIQRSDAEILLHAAPEPTTSFHGLGDLPGGSVYSEAWGVSGDGRVVVGVSNSAFGSEAFRWESGLMIGLSDLSGGSFSSEARAVTPNGSTIVGRGYSTAGNEACKWQDGVIGGLGFLPPINYPSTAAWGVSADGSVVVGGARVGPGDYGWKAARWVNGAITSYELAGYNQAEAFDVSTDGSIFVGHAWNVGSVPQEAFRCVNGVISSLGDFPGGWLCSAALGISPDGGVVVGQGHTSSGQDGEAFRWENGVMENLGHVPGGTSSAGWDCSENGTIVVGYDTVNSSLTAMIWDRSKGMRELTSVLVNDYGLNLTGWTLSQAHRVSDQGNIIIGSGINPSGQTEGWIVRLPEPDLDNDGVPDSRDNCPNTPPGEPADANGCSCSQRDTDGDGVNDCGDNCPDTLSCATVDAYGCPSDSDGDGVHDGCDQCLDSPPGSWVIRSTGCPTSRADLDRDGDVDQEDFGIFQRCSSGPDVPADPNCQ